MLVDTRAISPSAEPEMHVPAQSMRTSIQESCENKMYTQQSLLRPTLAAS